MRKHFTKDMHSIELTLSLGILGIQTRLELRERTWLNYGQIFRVVEIYYLLKSGAESRHRSRSNITYKGPCVMR